jgi:hypothetical protein
VRTELGLTALSQRRSERGSSGLLGLCAARDPQKHRIDQIRRALCFGHGDILSARRPKTASLLSNLGLHALIACRVLGKPKLRGDTYREVGQRPLICVLLKLPYKRPGFICDNQVSQSRQPECQVTAFEVGFNDTNKEANAGARSLGGSFGGNPVLPSTVGTAWFPSHQQLGSRLRSHAV